MMKTANTKLELKLDITKEIVSIKLHELNINKSPGPDNMHPKVVKELASVPVDPLRLGKIPSAWKLAAIAAIFKNEGNKQSTENYRTVSLTSIACKIGFLGGRSTVPQLLIIVDKWT